MLKNLEFKLLKLFDLLGRLWMQPGGHGDSWNLIPNFSLLTNWAWIKRLTFSQNAWSEYFELKVLNMERERLKKAPEALGIARTSHSVNHL